VHALDLPGMGYSQIVPGASYREPAMRAARQETLANQSARRRKQSFTLRNRS
jgi:hypothetical protein